MNYSTKTTNLDFLFNFTKGDKEKMSRYISMYIETTPQVIEEMQIFFKNGDIETVRLKAHSIKPQVQYMGIAELSEILLEIENIANHSKDFIQLAALIDSASTVNNKAVIELKKFFE